MGIQMAMLIHANSTGAANGTGNGYLPLTCGDANGNVNANGNGDGSAFINVQYPFRQKHMK